MGKYNARDNLKKEFSSKGISVISLPYFIMDI